MVPQPLVQFKAGICDVDETTRPYKIRPRETPGYIYLYKEEELSHFCWRPRSRPLDDPLDPSAPAEENNPFDLLMFAGDAQFEPWNSGGENAGVTNGRIYTLSFESSSTRYFFWLQSKSQHTDGKADHWTDRDYSLGRIVNEILNGADVDANQLYSTTRGPGGDDDDDDEDDDEDAEMHDADDALTGGAGAGATGGNANQEGEGSRRGGEDGARAGGNTRSVSANQPSQDDASTAVANLLRSLQGNPNLAVQGQHQDAQGKLFTTLSDLLQPSSTLAVVRSADDSTLNGLLSLLPPQLLLLAQESDDTAAADPNAETAAAAMQALTAGQKKDIINKVLHSPQFSQSLASLTAALRDGGLPTISDALKIKVENGGFIRRGAMPLGGGEAVEAFLKGIKATVKDEESQESSSRMETD